MKELNFNINPFTALVLIAIALIIAVVIRPELLEWILGIAVVIIAWIDGNL